MIIKINVSYIKKIDTSNDRLLELRKVAILEKVIEVFIVSIVMCVLEKKGER